MTEQLQSTLKKIIFFNVDVGLWTSYVYLYIETKKKKFKWTIYKEWIKRA